MPLLPQPPPGPTVDPISHEQVSFKSSHIIPRKRTRDTFLVHLGQIQTNDPPDKEDKRNFWPSESHTLPPYQPFHTEMGDSVSRDVSLSIAYHSKSIKKSTLKTQQPKEPLRSQRKTLGLTNSFTRTLRNVTLHSCLTK